ACELRASRRALVATTRTESVTICWVARWKRRSTFTVSAIDSGVRKPERNTPSPSRVTSRSSWMERRRPRVRRAIFSRTELDPISTAAKVGMRQGQQFTCQVSLGHPEPFIRKFISELGPRLGVWQLALVGRRRATASDLTAAQPDRHHIDTDRGADQ